MSGAARTLGVCTQRYPSARKHEAEQREAAAYLSDLLRVPIVVEISADDATTPLPVPSRGAIRAVGLDLDSIGM